MTTQCRLVGEMGGEVGDEVNAVKYVFFANTAVLIQIQYCLARFQY